VRINPTNCDNALTINIIDTTASIWTTSFMPQDIIVQCDVPQATMATDSCGEVVIKYNVIKVDGNCIQLLQEYGQQLMNLEILYHIQNNSK
jgi:hypothetical protein